MKGSRGLVPLQGVLKGGGAAPFFSLSFPCKLNKAKNGGFEQ